MPTNTDLLKRIPGQEGVSTRVVSSVFANLNEGNVIHAVEQFSETFTFTDHALNLEFTDSERLGQFFHKSRELFPDAQLEAIALFESGDHVVAEWTLTATHVELVWPGREARIRRSLPGVSVVAINQGRITKWSDYYDRISARRARLAEYFTEWIEL
jgi:hypothetical protein